MKTCIEKVLTSRARTLLRHWIKTAYQSELDEALNTLRKEAIESTWPVKMKSLNNPVREAFEVAFKKVVRSRIIEDGKRPDGRGTD